MRMLRCRGVDYAVADADGDGAQAPVLLFGHGLYFDHTMFADLIAAMGAGWRCVALDWPGHGGSGWHELGWSVQDLVQDTLALLDALGAQHAVAIGLSQGAAVFTRLALQHPARVRALVIMDASPAGATPQACERLRDAAHALASGDRARIAQVYDAAVQRMFSPVTHAQRPALVAAARARMELHPAAGMAHAVRLALGYESIEALLAQLAMPTLVLRGEDGFLEPAALDAYHRIPSVQIRSIHAAGHALALEQPAQVADALGKFFRRNAIHPRVDPQPSRGAVA